MALPSVGGGYQYTDGNLNELTIGVQPAPQTATSTATLTVTQLLGGLLVVDPTTTASTLTMPTAAAIDAVMTNLKTNSTFRLVVINLGTSTGIVTMAVGTGITAVGNLVVAITGSAAGVGGAAEFLFRKTGTAAYSVYRVA
ncbi:hypothetical protein UFOVP1362_49 [uncultured Caudovirales phage]|uniref:Uncharacterized protein n=1 Tax=uncultured Caudovirales phage TaxID=2100421 RepID=A0A6J5QTA2_9CAUD|nr:hypothetical protein UFOVP1101_33 [uncultured Caudovirales phage]CAB4202054.1 hypothetical protein UFOVP1362_49 [uncultured Caudovirales phage]